MSRRDRMSGNEAVAEAMRQINPDVMGAFPITPSTEIPQYFSKFIADGKVDTEFVAEPTKNLKMQRITLQIIPVIPLVIPNFSLASILFQPFLLISCSIFFFVILLRLQNRDFPACRENTAVL